MHNPVAAGIAAHDVALRIGSVGVHTAATRNLHRHTAAIVDECAMAGAVERSVSADHSSLGINTAEEGERRALAIYGLINAPIQHESVEPGVAQIASRDSAS